MAPLALATQCRYVDTSSGEEMVVKVVKVHYDDVAPYYTVMLPSGKCQHFAQCQHFAHFCHPHVTHKKQTSHPQHGTLPSSP
jgi:hypothetical protein